MSAVPATFVCSACGVERPMEKNRKRHYREGARSFVCGQACRNVFVRLKLMSGKPTRHAAGYLLENVGPGQQALAHRVVVERVLGHALPERCPVHHVNEDKTDNRNGNLVACEDDAYHKLLHYRAKIVRRGGKPGIHRICAGCDELRFITDWVIRPSGEPRDYCRFCSPAPRENPVVTCACGCGATFSRFSAAGHGRSFVDGHQYVAMQKDRCVNGHEMAGNNLIVSAGRRVCRTCDREKQRRYRERKAARAA